MGFFRKLIDSEYKELKRFEKIFSEVDFDELLNSSNVHTEVNINGEAVELDTEVIK